MSALAQKRVLVVEDELLIAMLIEDILADSECRVIGPFSDLNDAMVAARNETFDIALLDVNLCGQKVYPVADLLDQRGIPFLFLSGYGGDAVPGGRPGWRACAKPFTADDLTRMLSDRIQGH